MIRLSLSTVRCGRLSFILPFAASGAEALVQAWLVTMAKDTVPATTLPLNRLRWQNSFEKDCVTVTSGHAPPLSAIDFDKTLEEIGLVEGSELVLEGEPYERERDCCYVDQSRGPPPLLDRKWRIRMGQVHEELKQRVMEAQHQGSRDKIQCWCWN